MGLNIRIVKYSKEFMERSQDPNGYDKAIFITEGYAGTITECEKKVKIDFCPFCRTRLRRKYKDENFVQEMVNL